MLRNVAVQRIKDGLGFRTGGALDNVIVARLQEAQRELEAGKSLPDFLLREDEPLVLLEGEHAVDLPEDFIRVKDVERIRYYGAEGAGARPVFLERRLYDDASLANLAENVVPMAPRVYVIRKSSVDFINVADRDYNLVWSYFRRAMTLESDVENFWLRHAPEWLIGEAGWRLAADMRNKSAVELFTAMAKLGRAALLGEMVASEEADGPFVMGAGL